MSRRSPLTPQQLTEIARPRAAGQDGKPLAEMMRTTIEGTATAPEPVPSTWPDAAP
jgi:hypothetical protein